MEKVSDIGLKVCAMKIDRRWLENLARRGWYEVGYGEAAAKRVGPTDLVMTSAFQQ